MTLDLRYYWESRARILPGGEEKKTGQIRSPFNRQYQVHRTDQIDQIDRILISRSKCFGTDKSFSYHILV